MSRLHIIGEGKTEVNFVNKILANDLSAKGVITDSRAVITNEKKGYVYKGGFRRVDAYKTVRNDISRWLKAEQKSCDCYFSTMFDFYALPNDFPGQDSIKSNMKIYDKISILEEAFAKDIGDNRFIPYIQVHEFEALLFCDIAKLKEEYIENQKQIDELIIETASFPNPEFINDSPKTAPSKRILSHIPPYSKTGAWKILEKIGLEKIRSFCPHFNEWYTKLENLKKAG